jgi:hypothetical protein
MTPTSSWEEEPVQSLVFQQELPLPWAELVDTLQASALTLPGCMPRIP